MSAALASREALMPSTLMQTTMSMMMKAVLVVASAPQALLLLLLRVGDGAGVQWRALTTHGAALPVAAETTTATASRRCRARLATPLRRT